MKSNIVFIVGLGRSGTSLLHAMLNAHSEIAFTPETHFYQKYIANKKLKRKIENGSLELFIKILSKDDEFNRLGLDPVLCIATYKEHFNDSLDLKKFYKLLLGVYAQASNKKNSGDKDPKLILHIHEIVNDYPEAKIIHLARDPRGVLASRLRATWSMGFPFFLQALVCAAQLRIGLQQSSRLNQQNYLEILYEDLISDPEKTLNKICSFIGVPFEKRILNFQNSASTLVSSGELQWKKTTLGPLLKNNSDKWQEQLNWHEVFITEKICNQAFRYFLYKRKYPDTYLFSRLYGFFLQFIGVLFYLAYKMRV